MGILARSNSNILTDNGFTLERCNSYEKFVKLSDLYDAFVTVDIVKGSVEVYVEYECGGEVATYNFTIRTDFEEHPNKFFNELDEEVTDFLEIYMK